MTNSLFESFGVDLVLADRLPEQNSSHLHDHATRNLEDLQQIDRALRLVRDAMPRGYEQKLNGIYMNKLVDRMKKTGQFVFLCARCWKGIPDHRKLILDEAAGLVYGTDCYETISVKQAGLRYHYRPDGSKIPAGPGELRTYTCETMGRDFQALPENVQHCGASPRMCAACPGTAVRNKHVPCDFERAISLSRNTS